MYRGSMPLSATSPLQRGQFAGVTAGQPPDEVAVGQKPCDQSGEHNALEHREPLCAAILRDSRGAAEAHLQRQTGACQHLGSAGVALERAQCHLDHMEPGLGFCCGKRQRRRVLPPNPCALRVAYPHNCDSIRDSLAKSPRTARDVYRQLSTMGRLRR